MAKKMKGLSALIKASKNDESKMFLDDLIFTIQECSRSDFKPTTTYKPSGISGCERAMYYMMNGVQPDGATQDANLCGICESGTARHEDLQNYVMKMKDWGIECEWVDVKEYLDNNRGANLSKYTEVVKQQGNETKCFNSEMNMRFLCDGIIKYKGEYYILEIKTETAMKFGHKDAHPEHKKQATCYSLALGIDKVIFLYENRDNCSKDAFLVNITEAMKENVLKIIARVDKAVADKVVPMKTSVAKNCQYCDYRKTCKHEPMDELRVSLKGDAK